MNKKQMTNLKEVLLRGGMTEVYREMMWLLWRSPDVSKDIQEWLDSLSDKEKFKFSEQIKIQDLYIQIFGKLPD